MIWYGEGTYGHLQSSCSGINYTAMVTSLNVFVPQDTRPGQGQAL